MLQSLQRHLQALRRLAREILGDFCARLSSILQNPQAASNRPKAVFIAVSLSLARRLGDVVVYCGLYFISFWWPPGYPSRAVLFLLSIYVA